MRTSRTSCTLPDAPDTGEGWRMAISDEKLAELGLKHKRVKHFDFGAGVEFVIRAPTKAEYRAFGAALQNGIAVVAMEDHVRALVVWCNGIEGTWASVVEEFDKLTEVYPGLCANDEVAKAVKRFAGLEMANRGKG